MRLIVPGEVLHLGPLYELDPLDAAYERPRRVNAAISRRPRVAVLLSARDPAVSNRATLGVAAAWMRHRADVRV